ncbi:M16 family metallopeptidase [Clostridium neuense]|uniref:M16 family metallopeptidase n=1 Tax=Clostridium neuense TaxID=1728934 RepID=A0ABW8TIP1_9CLOT
MEENMLDLKEVKLSNGLQIISIKKNTQLFSLHFGVKIGSLYEDNKEKGISHFIEHMVFKGTSNMNNEQLNEAFEELGGEYNAYTDYNCTVYSVTALNEELDRSLYLISDMIRNAVFDKTEFNKEKEVILSEIRSVKDDIEDYSFNKVHEIGFSRGPLKYDTIGSEKNINKFTSEDLVDFYKRYYLPNNCCIVIVSNIGHEEVICNIEKYFDSWAKKDIIKRNILAEKNLPVKKVSYRNDIEQSTIIYMFTFHGLTRMEEMALKILNYRLGESANSILFREIREKKGLAYDIYSELNTSKYVKTMYIYTAVGKGNIDSAAMCIDKCLEKIKCEKNFIESKSIAVMKKVLKTAVVSTIEDTTDLSNYVLHQCLDGENIYEFLEDIKNVDLVNCNDITMVANKVLSNPTIHILTSKESD